MKYFKKYFAIIFLLVVILGFFSPLLKGKLPIPSDTIVGLYNPYRDFYAATYPRGIPFKNFLITDPVRQEYPWRNLAISLEKAGQLPLWNPYNFAGYPLLGNFQSAPFYPLNILLFLLPFQMGWSLLVLSQSLLGGIFLYFYLRSLKLHRWASLLGSMSFIFSGFFISWFEWNTVVSVVIWLPLILLAKDMLLKKWSWRWGLIFLFAECAAVFAGHIQILFYAICISNVYLFLKIWQKARKENKEHVILQGLKMYAPFLLVGIVMFAITAIQLLPTWQFIRYSARDVDQNFLTQAGWFVPWQHLAQLLVPDFFGNPTTLNYWGVWNYAELVGYVGILPLMMAFFAVAFRRDKKTYFFTSLVIVSLLFSLPTPLAQLPFMLHVPLLSSAQPTRLIFVLDFSLAILAALGFDLFLRNQKGIRLLIGGFITLFALIWAVAVKGSVFGIEMQNLSIARHNLSLPTTIFVVVSVLLLTYTYIRKRKHYVTGLLLLIVICITVFDLTRFASKFTPFTPQAYLFPQTKTIDFLQKNNNNFRIMTTDERIFPPNFSTMYKIQSVDGYDPLYLKSYAQLITAAKRNKADITPPFGFNRIITPHMVPNRIMDLLGVKYILSLTELKDTSLIQVFQEGDTRVYENKNVLPRAFFVTMVKSSSSQNESIEFLLDPSHDIRKEAVVNNFADKSFSLGEARIVWYQPNKVAIQTQNNAEGFLVLSDIYYPTWHVQIDGKESKIYLSDFIFRGIVVPPGQHTVVYQDTLL